MTENAALLGGPAVRTKPYPSHSTMMGAAEEQEVLEVLRSGHLSGFSARPGERFLGGPKVQKLEADFAAYFGVKFAVSLNSATSALHAALAAAGIGPGDEVITSPTTMSATASSVLMTNAIPVFADIEDETYGLDPASVAARITPRTKSILTVNLFGHPSRLEDLEALARKHDLLLIEDNAQAPGAMVNGRRAGTMGVMGIQSLNYHKGIQTGEGGVVLTNDPGLSLRLQLIRNHGEVVVDRLENPPADLVNLLGWNYRLTELQAAVGIPQLTKLDRLNATRIGLADRLTQGLRQFDFLTPPVVRPGCTHVYYLYPLRYHADRLGLRRETFVAVMRAEGISLAAGYVRPIYLEPMYRQRLAYGRQGCPFTCPFYQGRVSYEPGLCPVAERLHFEEILTTDICKYPNTEQEVEEFVHAVRKVADNLTALKAWEAEG
jgi:dTDP-4-amino-4,6-dideoxygalactose transaminase